MNVDAALAYAERHALHALVVQENDAVVVERYGAGYDAAKPHALYSGTKSFWGVLAVAAESDGLLDLEEPVSQTIPSWAEGAKSRVTLRDLLQLTSGIGFGGIPLQVFGAVLARKLEPAGLTPNAFLRRRILDPIGMRIGSWRALRDGTNPLPTGAFVAAREWLKFGQLVRDRGRWEQQSIVPEAALARCFAGSRANPRYGLCWWRSPLAERPDIVYASGSGGQALYVIPSAGLVVAKFGDSGSYKHEAFLKRLVS